MPEQDEKIFGEVYEIYNKYRWKQMEREELIFLSSDLANIAQKYGFKKNPLAWHLTNAILDVFDDLYRDGKVPEVPDYIGRSDL
ncbi:MAG: hypothetical protein J6S83_08970 [Lachnospiraceae bacterium]|nr:hypothetical protein [Lachnospiraceae bacterium]